MDYEVVLQKVIDVFSMISETNEEISADSELIEDLGVSSMDILMLICSLEQEFKIKVPEKLTRRMVTIGDVVDIIFDLIQKK